ncbi:serine/threonine protein kinase [Profundibacter sp.]
MVSTVKQIDQTIEQGGEDDFVDELKPGTELLHGQYTIEEFLNSGGFGITYLAKDSLDRRVVIKECFPNTLCRRSQTRVGARSRAHQSEFKSVINLFVQEAKSLAKLQHPNIVGVHQVFEDNDTAYMALDYIEGFDLLETLEEGGEKLPPEEINKILRKILGAVDYLHGRNILHRDISPDNILIDKKTSEPLLIDFGAAREEVSKASRVLSALRVVKDGYSPQEFYVNGSKQGPSSDLYALAASFYHLITGEMPPDSQTRLSAMASDEQDPYVPLVGRVDGYDATFLAAIDKALNVLPKDRIQTAKEWLEMISGGVSELPTATKTAKPAAGKTSKDSSEPAKSGSKMLLMTTAIVLVTAGGGFAVWKGMAPAPAEVTVNEAVDTTVAPTTETDTGKGIEAPVVVADTPVEDTIEVVADVVADTPVEDTTEVIADVVADTPVEDTTEVVADVVADTPVEDTTDVVADVVADTPVEDTTEVVADVVANLATTLDAGTPVETAPAAIETVVVAEQTVEPSNVETVGTLGFLPVASAYLPFSERVDQPGVIAKLGNNAPDWARVGQQITAINGVPVESFAQINPSLRNMENLGDLDSVQVVFNIDGSDMQQSATLDVLSGVVLPAGLELQIREMQDGTMRPVAITSQKAANSIKADDILLTYLDTGEKIGVDVSLEELLLREINKGDTKLNFIIDRGGKKWIAPIQLTDNN